MRTSIATVSLSGTLVQKLRAAAAAGFDGVEIFEQDLVVAPESPERIRELAAGLGLPGLAGFWGEIVAVVAALSPADGRPVPLFVGCAVVAAVGAALAAAYSLRVARLVWLGEGSDDADRPATSRAELARSELVPGAVLALVVVALGVAPGLVLAVTDPALGAVVTR